MERGGNSLKINWGLSDITKYTVGIPWFTNYGITK